MDSVSEEPAAAAAALRLLPVNLCVHYLLNRSLKKKKKKRQLCIDHIVDVLPSTGSYFFFIKVWLFYSVCVSGLIWL